MFRDEPLDVAQDARLALRAGQLDFATQAVGHQRHGFKDVHHALGAAHRAKGKDGVSRPLQRHGQGFVLKIRVNWIIDNKKFFHGEPVSAAIFSRHESLNKTSASSL